MASRVELENGAGSAPDNSHSYPSDGQAFGAAAQRWRDRISKTRIPSAHTSSGLELDAIYTPESIKQLDALQDIGLPGEYPFTRGVQPTMYRGRVWTMRQYSGFGTPRESNQRYKWLLEQGQTGISVALDLPTQLGLDSDDLEA